MKFLTSISLMMFVLLLGCTPPKVDDASVGNDDLDEFCPYVGNSADSQYCLTTFIQLLANPELFDGRNVMFRGWVLSVDGIVAIFPSKDAVDGGELNSSVIILSGTKRDALIAMAQSTPNSNPRMLTIGGKFRASHAIPQEENQAALQKRFGSLQDVNELRP